jgi:hypothetical protein
VSGLAGDVARALDATGLAPAVGLVLDEWQAGVLRSTARRQLLNVHRQGGKSTISSVKAVHHAVYRPRALVLIVSPSQRQSGELFAKVKAAYRDLGRPVPVAAENQTTLELENGSRIVSLPGGDSTIRGYSGVTLLILDEASRIDDDTWTAVSPMVAVSGGAVIAMSTPFGQRGWWHAEWEHGGSRWERVLVTADQCPRLTADDLAEQRAELGDWFYAQEFMGEFRDSTEQLLSTQLVDSMFTDKFKPLDLGGRS